MEKHRLVTAVAAVLVILVSVGVFIALTRQGGGEYRRLVLSGALKRLLRGAEPGLKVSSEAFPPDGPIPIKYTCDGSDESPPISVEGIPENAESLAIIMYDPDAPKGFFYHWILFNIPVNGASLEIPGSIEKKPVTETGIHGLNDFGNTWYNGPCPPPGEKHRYYLLVVALDTRLSLGPGASIDEVAEASEGHAVSYGYVVSTYSR